MEIYIIRLSQECHLNIASEIGLLDWKIITYNLSSLTMLRYAVNESVQPENMQ